MSRAWKIEWLAKRFHQIYQEEAKRQGNVKYPDNYDDLPENVKRYDIVLAEYVDNCFLKNQYVILYGVLSFIFGSLLTILTLRFLLLF